MIAGLRPAALAAAACLALSAGAALAATPAPTVVHVQLDNTGDKESMKVDPATVRAGKVRFEVANESMDDEHEMIVVKTTLTPDKFPTNKDRSRVDEKKFTGAQEVSELKPGGKGELVETLKPGHYVLYCNVKNHFKNGMYAELTVTP